MDLKNACISGDLKTVESLLYKKYDDEDYYINAMSANRALLYGCKGGHLSIVELAISKGAGNLNDGFCTACEHGHMNIVKFLILKVDDFNWDSRLYNACKGGNVDIVFIILKAKDHEFNWNYGLYGACEGGNMDVVNMMISKGADEFNTGLYNASSCNHFDIALHMIEKGVTDYYFRFKCACERGDMEIVKLIVSNFDLKENLKRGFDCACAHGQMALVEYFISEGVYDLNDGLENAHTYGHNDIVKLLTRLLIAKNRRFKYNIVQDVFETDIKMLSEIMNKDLIHYTLINI
jgi:hypothetical protein